ncbi:unnamed protein product [Adineta steineri]|uniref:Uncharacterized protein n=1 Tax=Adineta steineri TaxID=433720 RepID=A0A815U5F4_9BILA|nr:unnamed protein product [Adineta steineri]CAF1646900.1 unnamed protein product [Adineta steineri]
MDATVKKALDKDPGPNATPSQKQHYDTYIDEVTNNMGEISKWIGWLFEKVWEAIKKVIDWFRRLARGVVNFANEVFDGIKSWWSSLW